MRWILSVLLLYCVQNATPVHFEGGAVKAMKAQFLTVQMSREVLEDGGGACDRNITRAAYQNLDW